MLTPSASIVVSISTPQGESFTTGSRSSLRTAARNDATPTGRDLRKGIEEFREMLRESELKRREESQIVQYELRALKNDFRDLAQFLRGRQPR